jgi:hypothetical protein
VSPRKSTASGSSSAEQTDPEPEGAVESKPSADTQPAEAAPEVVFTHRSAGGSVVIFWRGRQVKTVGGAVGASLRRKLADADEATAQALLTRASGNFKRGTERRR